MNLHQLRIFCAIVEEGSFRLAAQKLFLSQPSVSQQVAALEKDLGIRLFQRKGRSVSLTPEGRSLHILASDLLHQADSIPARFRDMRSLSSGSLQVGASFLAARRILPEALGRFLRDFPSITIQVTSGTEAGILSGLLEGKTELAIVGRLFPPAQDPSLTCRPLGRDPLILVTGREHPWASGKHALPSEMEGETLIRFSGECPLAAYVDEFLLRNRVRFAGQVEVDEIELAGSLAEAGAGIAITSSLSVRGRIADGRLAAVRLQGLEKLSWEIQCVYSSRRGLSYPGWEMVKRLEAAGRDLLF